MAEESFEELMQRLSLSAGDEDAVAVLVRRHESRRVVRVRLTSQTLRHQFDSMDVCQSVMADLLDRASHGQLEFGRRLSCRPKRSGSRIHLDWRGGYNFDAAPSLRLQLIFFM